MKLSKTEIKLIHKLLALKYKHIKFYSNIGGKL